MNTLKRKTSASRIPAMTLSITYYDGDFNTMIDSFDNGGERVLKILLRKQE